MIEASFYGTEGGASLRIVGSPFHDFTVERFRGTSRETVVAPPDAGAGAAVAWAEALAAGARYDPAVEGLVQVAEVLDAVYARSRPCEAP